MTKRIPRTHNVIMFSRSRAFDYDSPASDSKLQPRNKEKDLWRTRRWRITFYWPEGTSISADCSDSSDLSRMNPQPTVMKVFLHSRAAQADAPFWTECNSQRNIVRSPNAWWEKQHHCDRSIRLKGAVMSSFSLDETYSRVRFIVHLLKFWISNLLASKPSSPPMQLCWLIRASLQFLWLNNDRTPWESHDSPIRARLSKLCRSFLFLGSPLVTQYDCMVTHSSIAWDSRLRTNNK